MKEIDERLVDMLDNLGYWLSSPQYVSLFSVVQRNS